MPIQCFFFIFWKPQNKNMGQQNPSKKGYRVLMGPEVILRIYGLGLNLTRPPILAPSASNQNYLKLRAPPRNERLKNASLPAYFSSLCTSTHSTLLPTFFSSCVVSRFASSVSFHLTPVPGTEM